VPPVADPLRLPTLLAVQAERGRRSLKYFFKHFAWPVLYPGVQFIDGWHVHAVCEHLEAVKRRQIKKLYINMPGRHLKSSLVTQAFNAWDWIDDPQLTYLTASYINDLAVRDAVNTRRIIQSRMYQDAFGHGPKGYRLLADQNEKTMYANSRGGFRRPVGVETGVTGYGGNRRIVDDPVDPLMMNSATKIASGVEWWKGTFSTRVNDPKNDTIVLAQQRLSENDTTGYVIKNEDGWEGLVIPGRYELEHRRRATVLGWVDPRTREGELIQPARIGEKEMKETEKNLGNYHRLAQIQQRPEPRGGIMFQRSNYKFWTKATLPQLDYVVLSIDAAFKDSESSDHVAIQAWGFALSHSNKVLLRRVKERMSFKGTCDAVRTTHALFPEAIATLIEDKANGSAVINTLSGVIPGVVAVTPEGGKAARGFAMQPEQEVGCIWLPDPTEDPDIETFLSASSSFTGAEGGDDDEVDSMTQAINWIRERFKQTGLQQLMEEQYKAAQAAAVNRPVPVVMGSHPALPS
jgi:predicted phage terminase large subunit-like protein